MAKKKKEADKTVRMRPLPKGARKFSFKCNRCGFTAEVSGKTLHEALDKALDAHEDHHRDSGSFCAMTSEIAPDHEISEL